LPDLFDRLADTSRRDAKYFRANATALVIAASEVFAPRYPGERSGPHFAKGLTPPALRETIPPPSRSSRSPPSLRPASRLIVLCALLASVSAARADSSSPARTEVCLSTFDGSLDTTNMQPKDFAMVRVGTVTHIFYTRQYSTHNYNDHSNTRAIGHAVSNDRSLSTWTVVDCAAIAARSGRVWDNMHVWAPSIVYQDGTWFMFYTGVQYDTVATSPQLVTTEIQRIGVATSTDLYSWKQDPTPVLAAKMIPWTYQDSTAIGNGGVGWQFRDPFVMADPDRPGEWLMYYVAIDSTLAKFVVGVAGTEGGDLRQWHDIVPIRRTSAAFMQADRDESPQVFERDGTWWLIYMSNHFAANDQITYVLSAGSPSDSSGWSDPDSLKAVTCGEHGYPSPLNQLHALEHMQTGQNEIMAGFSTWPSGTGLIQFSQMQPVEIVCPTDSLRFSCPDAWVGVDGDVRVPTRVTLELIGGSPVRSTASLRLTLADRGRVHVAIYDAAGRRVRTLLDGAAAGVTVLPWDGRGEDGRLVSSGVYFARATAASGRAIARIPLAR